MTYDSPNPNHPDCKRHRWQLVQNPTIRLAYRVWCQNCGLGSEYDVLISQDDKPALKRRLIKSVPRRRRSATGGKG